MAITLLLDEGIGLLKWLVVVSICREKSILKFLCRKSTTTKKMKEYCVDFDNDGRALRPTDLRMDGWMRNFAETDFCLDLESSIDCRTIFLIV